MLSLRWQSAIKLCCDPVDIFYVMDNSIQFFRISRLYESFVPAAGGAGRYFFLLDIASDVARWSPEAVSAFALPGEFVKNNTLMMRKILSPEDASAFEKDLEAVRRRSVEKKETVWKMKNAAGETIPCTVKYFTVRDYAGMPAYLAAAITGGGVEQHTDPTTSLPDQLSFLDHLKGCAGFDRSADIHPFIFHKNICIIRANKLVETDHRGVANCFQNIFKNHQTKSPASIYFLPAGSAASSVNPT